MLNKLLSASEQKADQKEDSNQKDPSGALISLSLVDKFGGLFTGILLVLLNILNTLLKTVHIGREKLLVSR